MRSIKNLILVFIFAFLFFTPAFASADTLYYDNSAADGDWANLDSWWSDAGHTIQALALPDSSDDVRIQAPVDTNSGDPISINSMNVESGHYLGALEISVGGIATFEGTSSNAATITGNAVFNNQSDTEGVINGNVTFNDESRSADTINGNVTFNDESYNDTTGVIEGTATFNDFSVNNASGTVIGTSTFNGQSSNYGTINGDAVFNTTAYHTSAPSGGIFTLSTLNWSGEVTGTVYGSDSVIITNYIFRETAENDGIVTGAVDVYFPATNPIGGTVNGAVTYHNYPDLYFDGSSDGDWNNLDNWWSDIGFTVQALALPDSSDHVGIYENIVTNGGALASVNKISFILSVSSSIEINVADTANFYASSNNQGTINGNSIFNDTSYNDLTINGNATFNGTTSNNGTINGNAVFNGGSLNDGTITGNATFNTTGYHTTAPTGGVFTLSQENWGGIVNGTVYGSDDVAITSYVFNGGWGMGSEITGNAIFNDNGNNDGDIHGNATFNDASSNDGNIYGNATFNGTSISGGTITGNATYNTLGYHTSVPSGGVFTFSTEDWSDDVSGTVYGSDGIAITSYVFNSGRSNSGVVVGSPLYIFNSSGGNNNTLTGNSIFNDDSNNSDVINGNAAFHDDSINYGTVTGNACFSPTATNSGTVNGTVSVCSAPSVTSTAASSLTPTSATINATLVDVGSGFISQHGFAYGTDVTLSTVIATTTLGNKNSAGTFSSNISSLTCGTAYYFRPYAIAGGEYTGFGAITSFSTSACPSSGGGGYSSGGGAITYIPPANNNPIVCSTGQIFNTITGQRCTTYSGGAVGTPNIPNDMQSMIFTRNLTVGMRGEDVVQLQNLLISKNLLEPIYNTGYFGPITRASLIKYQQANNITPAEGYFGAITRASINNINLTPAAQNIPNTSITPNSQNLPANIFYRDLKIGMSGEDVKQLQIFLQSAGHLNLGTLAPTTYFGPLTKQALISYQQAQGIAPAEGYFGAITRDRVGR